MSDYPNTSREQHVTSSWNNYSNHWNITCWIIPTLVLNSMLQCVGITIPTTGILYVTSMNTSRGWVSGGHIYYSLLQGVGVTVPTTGILYVGLSQHLS